MKDDKILDKSEPTALKPTIDSHQEVFKTTDNVLIAGFAGVASGVVASIVTCPLDVVKTRVQLQAGQVGGKSSHLYRGTWSSLNKIVAEEGVRGLYHGLWSTTVGLTCNWAVYFTAYNKFKSLFGNWSTLTKTGSPMNHLCASVSAGAITAAITSPLWVIKTRFQTYSIPHSVHGVQGQRYDGVMKGMIETAKTEGIGALYKGLGVSLIGLIHVAIQFPLYEHLKQKLADEKTGHLDLQHLILASAVSKTIAVAVSYPHEVVRSRQQHATGNLKMISTFKSILKIEGFRGFYHGLSTNLLRVVPSCVITFTTYEYVVATLRKAIVLQTDHDDL